MEKELKLFYFDFPGFGESSRLILTYGGVPFQDVRIRREQWPEYKPQTPFGHLPAMKVGETWIAQSSAIELYVATLAKLAPTDPLELALAQQVLFLMYDAINLLMATRQLLPPEAVQAAQAELLAGSFKKKLQGLSNALEGKRFFLGEELCYVDLSVFSALSIMRAGFLDGFPVDFLDGFPALKAFHARVAHLPQVKQYYAGRTGQYVGYQVEVDG